MIILTSRETQLCTAHSHVMWTSGAYTLGNIYLPNSRISLTKNGASYLTRYCNFILGLKPTTVHMFTVQTKSIWLGFFGRTLHGNRSLARISLRASLGEEPTEEQLVEKCESIKPPGIRKALAEKLRTEISQAFNRGEEV